MSEFITNRMPEIALGFIYAWFGIKVYKIIKGPKPPDSV